MDLDESSVPRVTTRHVFAADETTDSRSAAAAMPSGTWHHYQPPARPQTVPNMNMNFYNYGEQQSSSPNPVPSGQGQVGRAQTML